jgi:pimeloyl-ACP methyl ester carboxylesterase
MKKPFLFFTMVLAVTVSAVYARGRSEASTKTPEPLIIQEQGSFAVGGTVITNPGTFDPAKPSSPEGQTLHGDHAYVFYQIPVNPRKLPIMFLHGAGQFSKTYGTTPDGREGFQNIFLRRGFGVYMIEQPRRGNAGRSTESVMIEATGDDQSWFDMFRVGNFPNYYEGVQFPRDQESLNQYFRQMTPNTGPYDSQVISDSIAALFDKVGEGILVTHSQGGSNGWQTAMKSPNVKAIVSYEPAIFFFPEGEVPPPVSNVYTPLAGIPVPIENFLKLTKIPIIIYYGDNIPETPVENVGQDTWRACFKMAKLWAEAVNRHGGDVTVVHLPEIGIHGNTHFPFSDLNNIEIADLMSQWLKEKSLDK